MERKAVSGILVILLLIGMLTLALNFQLAEATNLPVHNINTGEDFATIQEAIDDYDTLDGHTVFVEEGIYSGSIRIWRSISLIGENVNNTIIEENEGFSGVIVVENQVKNARISGFTVRNSIGPEGTGIHVGGYNCSVSGNSILNNYYGVELYSNNTTVSDNNLSNNTFGINLRQLVENNRILNNIIWNNSHGIQLMGGTGDNLVSDNNVLLNTYRGIYLSSSSRKTAIIGNNILSNGWGQPGLYSGGLVMFNESNDTIYHNNFINNTNQIHLSSCGNSSWDNGYPSGGNYWSDYESVDADGDGIGDTLYFIDENNQDNYPLMEPWSPSTMIKTLIRTVKFWSLHKGTETSLASKLEGALRLLDIENDNAGVPKLMAFINEVEALRNKKLTIEQAEQLIAEAQRIIDLING